MGIPQGDLNVHFSCSTTAAGNNLVGTHAWPHIA